MKIAVYLGSRPGSDPKFKENAHELGRLLAANGIEVIYGGASVGTMGALAEGVREAGGLLTGVFPKGFKGRKDLADAGVDVRNTWSDYPGYRYLETPTFDERIRAMESMAGACIILPGSYGTMHEFFSFFEGNEVGRFRKPLFILNTDGYYDPLLELVRRMVDAGFTPEGDFDLLFSASTPEELVRKVLSLAGKPDYLP